MKVNYRGCALCDSTWGDVWAEVEGERRFFCCDTCRVQFLGLVDRVKSETGWASIDSLEITGDRHGRTCEARSGPQRVRWAVRFDPSGAVRTFLRLPTPPPVEPSA